MGLPQAIMAGLRWTVGREQPRLVPEEKPLRGSSGKAMGRIAAELASDVDRSQGIAPDKDWGNFLKSYGQYSWLYACVSLIGHTIAGVTPVVYQRRGQDWKEAPDHKLSVLLDYVNPEASWEQFAYLLAVDLELTGNTYTHLARGKTTKEVRELWRVNPSLMHIVPDKEGKIDHYLFKAGNDPKGIRFEADEIVHLQYPNPNDDWKGLGATGPAKDAAEADSYTIASNTSLVKSGAQPRGVMTLPEGTTKDQAQGLLEAWDKNYSGGNAHRTAFLPIGQWTPLEFSPRDMQYEIFRKMNREEICAVFKVPPGMVGILDYANYANLREQRKIFWEDCIIPKLRLIEGGLNEFLSPQFGSDVQIRFDLSGVEALRDDIAEKVTVAVQATGAKFWTPNEAREFVGRFPTPLPDGVGNVIWGTFNEMPLAQIASGGGAQQAAPKQLLAARKKRLPRDRKEHVWKRYIGRVDRWVPVLHEKAKGVYEDLTAEVVGNLREAKSLPVMEKALAGEYVLRFLFDVAKAATRFTQETTPVSQNVMRESGTEALADIGRADAAFNLSSPAARAFLRQRQGLIKTVAETYHESLRNRLAVGMEQGATLSQMAESIEAYGAGNVDFLSERIARTEVGAASNAGALEGYVQGGAEYKEWIHSYGAKQPREAHQALADAGPIPIDEDFVSELGGVGPGPGSMNDPADDVNCSCTLVAIFAEDMPE